MFEEEHPLCTLNPCAGKEINWVVAGLIESQGDPVSRFAVDPAEGINDSVKVLILWVYDFRLWGLSLVNLVSEHALAVQTVAAVHDVCAECSFCTDGKLLTDEKEFVEFLCILK